MICSSPVASKILASRSSGLVARCRLVRPWLTPFVKEEGDTPRSEAMVLTPACPSNPLELRAISWNDYKLRSSENHYKNQKLIVIRSKDKGATSTVGSHLVNGHWTIFKCFDPIFLLKEGMPRLAILNRTCEARNRFAQGLLQWMARRRIRLRHVLPLQKNRGF